MLSDVYMTFIEGKKEKAQAVASVISVTYHRLTGKHEGLAFIHLPEDDPFLCSGQICMGSGQQLATGLKSDFERTATVLGFIFETWSPHKLRLAPLSLPPTSRPPPQMCVCVCVYVRLSVSGWPGTSGGLSLSGPGITDLSGHTPPRILLFHVNSGNFLTGGSC